LVRRSQAAALEKQQQRGGARCPGVHSFGVLAELLASPCQNGAELRRADPACDQRGDLLEGKPEVLENEDPVELLDLGSAVEAVPARGIDLRRAQQSDPGVVPERLDWNLCEPREVADPVHGYAFRSRYGLSPGWRVKVARLRAPRRSGLTAPRRESPLPGRQRCADCRTPPRHP